MKVKCVNNGHCGLQGETPELEVGKIYEAKPTESFDSHALIIVHPFDGREGYYHKDRFEIVEHDLLPEHALQILTPLD